MRSKMCETCACRNVPSGKTFVAPEPLHPCHEHLKETCQGSLLNMRKKGKWNGEGLQFLVSIEEITKVLTEVG